MDSPRDNHIIPHIGRYAFQPLFSLFPILVGEIIGTRDFSRLIITIYTLSITSTPLYPIYPVENPENLVFLSALKHVPSSPAPVKSRQRRALETPNCPRNCRDLTGARALLFLTFFNHFGF